MQRRRLLTATLEVVFVRGVQAVTVTSVSDRAGVSRKTFYDIFEDRDGCLLAAFEKAMDHATRAVEQAADGEKSWREALRAGITGLLSFLDDEPGAGRLLIVDALSAGDRALEVRRRVLAQITTTFDEGRKEAKTGRELPSLTAEGVVGAVFSVIHARMLERDPRPLVELAGPLMAMIVQFYLGPTVAQKELDRPMPVAKRTALRLPTDPFKDLPIRLTYRTALVLSSIAGSPGASSKQIAAASGVADQGQMSRLLARLERVGLVQNSGTGPINGGAKAWSLTDKGHTVHGAITEQTHGT
jgi:AcrR family transcriptional regulator/DNA-binding MarR family transcriptional regulator